MNNKILLIITFVLSGVLIIVSSKYHTTFFVTEVKNINVKDSDTNQVSTLNLEDYIVGVVAAEMPASFNIEALKAQAVAARTYAVYKIENNPNQTYDVVTDVSNQSYITIDEMKDKWENDFNKYYNKIKEAVKETKGEVLKYNGDVIIAFYFAMSNGYTEDASLVFSEQDYLKSVASVYDNSSLKNFEVTEEFTISEVCNKLGLDSQNLIVSDIKRSSTHRVNSLVVNGVTFKGTEFRSKLNLRSTDFDITINKNKVRITTRGYGHGVGMSQYGANGMANAGKNYEEILTYYYKNVKLSSI